MTAATMDPGAAAPVDGDACELAGRCSGCALIGSPYEAQLEQKAHELRKRLREAGVTAPASLRLDSPGTRGLRDRVDLTLQGDGRGVRIGLYGKDHRQIVDMPRCPQMSDALAAWYAAFRADLPRIDQGSIRLRVSPAGQRGAWLDLPNATVRDLLDDAAWLGRLLDAADCVEIGQKRKRLGRDPDGGALKLLPAELGPWWETYVGPGEEATPIYTQVGSFTQPGFAANRLLVRTVRALAEAARPTHVLELCAGAGNLTLPLAALGARVTALEVEPSACQGLERAVAERGLGQQISAQRLDVQRVSHTLLGLLERHDLLVADPPRSGLRDLVFALESLPRKTRPRHLLYVSCFAPTLVQDAAALGALGYVPTRAVGVDQFPQTPHCEWVTLFERH